MFVACGAPAHDWAAPTEGRPILLDMSTSMTPEGKIRTALHSGQSLPEGHILDGDGHPTTDPAAFYGAGDGPPEGTILPFGGDLGYRGFGLALLVEVLGASMGGVELGDAENIPYINGFSLLAIDPGAVTGDTARFSALTEQLRAYITGSPPAPGHDEVILPGEREFRTLASRQRQGIPLSREACRLIDEVAEKVGVHAGL